ncbi:DUF3558 domain-containing protein [Rhodococcus erythropolis]|uniref:DUF3558 domain-containing protein n=1 Tax=Rhodococcus erythropolis TaxID=1833 RepID=A0A401N3A0_RHOER|nr:MULTISPECIES: DUF3558 domain-containing protein [Rhodococcus]ALU72115.1 hypothetical protein H351_23950 [Rhodococcus erythropolis R138]ATI34139.1 DUF3558 domain-containing protein [Rhodococcus sp. H-CA8f]MBH5142730.1 DUF3558 domain-containing protein [Rhodococcus erythropolis]MBO8148353.1 DUF3558 domain-containing protein [Rhodococcus erythropolis]MBT1255854.1 DUF3558 domain-containing protein [Rhodococcus erythropolis]
MAARTLTSIGTSVLVSAAVLSAVVGCSSDDGSADRPGDDASSPALAPTDPGPMFAECGSVTDEEVVNAFNLGAFATTTRNGVGCQWEVAGSSGPSVSFSWYRGSPIGRERAGSDLLGRPAADITIGGHQGFIASTAGSLCELGIAFGGDFVHWSITYGLLPPTADPCTVARDLMEKTVSRAQ